MRLSRWEGFGMLHWQPQKLHERALVTRLLSASLLLHALLCLALFFYNAAGHKITFDTKRMLGKGVVVKLVPFGQQKPKAIVGVKGATQAVVKKTGVVAPSQKKKQANVHKKDIQKAVKKMGIVQKKETAVQKNLKKKQKAKQEAQKKVEQPVQQMVAQEVQKVAEPVVPVEKKEETPTIQEQKIEQPPTVPVQQQKGVSAESAQEQSNAQEAGAEQNVVYVNQEEFAEIEMQRLLAEALVQAWHPPVGIPEHVTCQAILEVDWQGNLTSYQLTQVSGIMIYDVSVEEGIKALTLPRAVWGKTIELIFKPWAE